MHSDPHYIVPNVSEGLTLLHSTFSPACISPKGMDVVCKGLTIAIVSLHFYVLKTCILNDYFILCNNALICLKYKALYKYCILSLLLPIAEESLTNS